MCVCRAVCVGGIGWEVYEEAELVHVVCVYVGKYI